MNTKTLTPEQLHKMDAYWHAANYLSVGQIYTRHGQVSPAHTPSSSRSGRPVAALRFLAIERLLRVIAPCHETNMTHTFS